MVFASSCTWAPARMPYVVWCMDGSPGGMVQNQPQGKQLAPIGPKRTVSVHSFEIKLGVGSPTTFTIGGGSGNTAASSATMTGTIAVPNPADFGAGLSDVMITVLTESNAFTAIDLPNAHDVGAAPVIADRPQYLIKAVVTEISCRERSGGITIGVFGGGQGQYENKVTLDVRLVDPLTSMKATGKKTSKGSMFGLAKFSGGSCWDPVTKVLDLSFSDFQSSPLAEAARLAIEDSVKKLKDKVAKRPWEAAVLRIVPEKAGLEIYLSLPGDCGLNIGEKLEICRYGDGIVDPKTGQVVGRTRPKPFGLVEVFMTDTDKIICKPIGDLKDRLADGQGLFVRLPRSQSMV